MNIFYCCGVLEPQKKIWWKNFLEKEGHATISKKFNPGVSHVVCGRESTSLEDVTKATNGAKLTDVKVVHTSWLLSCIRAKKRVPEDDHVVKNTGAAHSLDNSSSKRSRDGSTATEETEDGHRAKQQKHDSAATTPDPMVTCPAEPLLHPPPSSLRIGSVTVFAYGLGTLAWGVSYPDPSARPAREDVSTLVTAASVACVPLKVLVDTADSYCTDSRDFGYMESVLGEMRGSSPLSSELSAIVATKGGMKRIGSESNSWREASHHTAEAWEDCIRASLRRLRCDEDHPLSLWQVHHCKPVHLAAVMTALQKLVAERLILHVGLCNVSVADIEFCQQYLPIVSIQNAYSLWDRTAERPLSSGRRSSSKRGVLDYCSEHSIPFLAYGVLGGLAARRGEDKWRAFPELLSLAEKKNIHITTLVLAMMRHRYPCLLPLVGTRSQRHVEMLPAAAKVRLTRSELEVFPSLD